METKADSIRSHVMEHYIGPARRRGEETITIVAKAILRDMQLRGDRAPSVCRALDAKKFCKEHDLELVKVDGPKAKSSTTTAFTFRLGRRLDNSHHERAMQAIWNLRGAGKETFAALGGGERWLRRERESFYESGRGGAVDPQAGSD